MDLCSGEVFQCMYIVIDTKTNIQGGEGGEKITLKVSLGSHEGTLMKGA